MACSPLQACNSHFLFCVLILVCFVVTVSWSFFLDWWFDDCITIFSMINVVWCVASWMKPDLSVYIGVFTGMVMTDGSWFSVIMSTVPCCCCVFHIFIIKLDEENEEAAENNNEEASAAEPTKPPTTSVQQGSLHIKPLTHHAGNLCFQN